VQPIFADGPSSGALHPKGKLAGANLYSRISVANGQKPNSATKFVGKRFAGNSATPCKLGGWHHCPHCPSRQRKLVHDCFGPWTRASWRLAAEKTPSRWLGEGLLRRRKLMWIDSTKILTRELLSRNTMKRTVRRTGLAV